MPLILRSIPRSAVVLLLVALAGLLASCSSTSSDADPVVTTTAPSGTAETGTAARLCAAELQSSGELAPSELAETSGIVASRSQPGVVWAHNDSGAGAVVFAVGLDGSDLGRVEIEGARSVDWEDIALRPGGQGASDQLLVADIGDNPGGGSRTSQPVRLYRLDEPPAPGAGSTGSVGPAVAVDLAYADGPRDAETLLADPLTGDVFVVSKQWDGTGAGLYLVPTAVVSAAVAPGEAVTMERAATVATTEGDLVTGGDVSADGRAVVLRTYTGVLVWDRDPARSVADTLAGAPSCRVPVFEPQGEAVAVLADGSGFVTVSEGTGAEVLVRRSS